MSDKLEFQQWFNKWQKRLEMQQESREEINELMRKNNPSIIPRNHRVEGALEAAVKNSDFSVMEALLNVLSNPFAPKNKLNMPNLPTLLQYHIKHFVRFEIKREVISRIHYKIIS
ncbi:hypothetical protein GCM10008025_09350 [Ornithinibacillus halotolerans]|uniref:Uncharacterized protein n=1 Tax=Ornithinibacillus halotolerans TaxID=1274357 RepID=A0A916RSK8_9BACI|nr:hypothetical protein GCM10008025_09350 [Ornithinibacillus halotolerans]